MALSRAVQTSPHLRAVPLVQRMRGGHATRAPLSHRVCPANLRQLSLFRGLSSAAQLSIVFQTTPVRMASSSSRGFQRMTRDERAGRGSRAPAHQRTMVATMAQFWRSYLCIVLFLPGDGWKLFNEALARSCREMRFQYTTFFMVVYAIHSPHLEDDPVFDAAARAARHPADARAGCQVVDESESETRGSRAAMRCELWRATMMEVR